MGQQAEPACTQQGKCMHCFEKTASELGIQADVIMVRLQGLRAKIGCSWWCLMVHWMLTAPPALSHHCMHVVALYGACVWMLKHRVVLGVQSMSGLSTCPASEGKPARDNRTSVLCLYAFISIVVLQYLRTVEHLRYQNLMHGLQHL